MKKLIQSLKMIAAAALGLAAAPESSHAASIQFETLVKGQENKGYVLVLPERRFQLGGRVQWDAALRRWVTDRVSRLEHLRITLQPTTRSERVTACGYAGVSSSNGFVTGTYVPLPYVETRFSVSRDPSFDNVYVYVRTSAGLFEKRLPIGSR